MLKKLLLSTGIMSIIIAVLPIVTFAADYGASINSIFYIHQPKIPKSLKR